MFVPTITPGELEELRRRGRAVDLIDVRTPAEYRRAHAELARLVPLDALDPEGLLRARGGPGGDALYVICRSGGRGRQAVERLHAAGLTAAVNVEGGTIAWERAGLPVVRGRGPISLDRQVRIAAGSLVMLGAGLGAFVHPAFLGLAAFVGAGLAFSGITDTCGMGMALAKLPWNRAGDGPAPPVIAA